jgi:hypothetical protein
MTRSTFFNFNAYVGTVVGQHECKWWPDDPATYKWNSAFQIPIDLSKTPEAARQGKIKVEDILVDDFLGLKLGGRTTIGPDFPFGKTVGCCALEANYYDSLPASIKPGRIPPGFQCREYEMTSYYYWDGPLAHRRYYGFHAEIKGITKTHALVSIFAPGRSLVPNEPPRGTFWLDLNRSAHPIDKDCTEIGIGASEPRIGALFLEMNTVRVLTMDPSVKHPSVFGAECMFPPR